VGRRNLLISVQARPKIRIHAVSGRLVLALQAGPGLQIPTLQQHGPQAGQLGNPQVLAGHHQPGQAGMQRKARHPLPEGAQQPLFVQGTQAQQQLFRRFQGFGGWGLEPGHLARRGNPKAVQGQERFRQIAAPDLGCIEGRSRLEVRFREKTQAEPRPLPPGPARPLDAAGLADALGAQAGEARPGGVRGLPAQPRIDDDAHAVQGDAALGHIRAEEQLGLRRGRYGGLLGLEGEAPVQRQHL